jgi:hypothetical protein
VGALRRARIPSSHPSGRPILSQIARADRKSLLLGTALASTLLLGSLIAPMPAQADATCPPGDPLHIENSGTIAATGNQYAAGIVGSTYSAGNAITVEN